MDKNLQHCQLYCHLECRLLTQEMRGVSFGFAKQNMVRHLVVLPPDINLNFQRDGADSQSIVAKLLEASQARNRPDDQAISEVAATAYAGIYYSPFQDINI
jgi:hypothetical protein